MPSTSTTTTTHSGVEAGKRCDKGYKPLTRNYSANNFDPQLKPGGSLDDTVHLLYFSSRGNLDAVKGLIEEGTDVNSTDYDGRTALHLAASEGKIDVIQLLLSSGADVNPLDRFGSTPLMDAQRCGSSSASNILIARGGAVIEKSSPASTVMPKPSSADIEMDPLELDFKGSTLIGKGNLGKVLTAKWRGTHVAVKSIYKEISEIPELESQFKAELRALRRLRHPHIVQFLGAVTESKPYMLVTEFCPGGTLKDVLAKKKGKLTAAEAVGYALGMARGINYLHQRKPEPIMHRSLKPSNLLLDGSGHLKVSDFGLSCVVDSQFTQVLKEQRVIEAEESSYRYMAPELYHREAYDKAVDVYSFGMILYEMFEGQTDSAEEHLHRLSRVGTSRPPLTFKAAHYPPGMKELISRCLESDPRSRPLLPEVLESLESMVDALSEEAKQTLQKDEEEGAEQLTKGGCHCSIL